MKRNQIRRKGGAILALVLALLVTMSYSIPNGIAQDEATGAEAETGTVQTQLSEDEGTVAGEQEATEPHSPSSGSSCCWLWRALPRW